MRIDGHPLAKLRDDAEVTVMVAAAQAAGVFRVLADGPATPDDVARRAALDRRAIAILLPALVEAGLLVGRDGTYAPTPECHAGLCDPASPEFVAKGLAHWLNNLRAWTVLDETLRTGVPTRPGGQQRDREGLARFMAAMAAAPSDRVRRLVDGCARRARRLETALDVGGGPGHVARELAARGARVTLFDTPETVAFVRDEYDLGATPGLALAAGDFTVDALPDGPHDVVVLSNVMHIYGPEQNRRLLAEAARVTAPGGVVAIQEFVRGRSRRAARFALVMLMRTEEGNTYDEGELAGWMEEAGLANVEVEDLDPDRQLVTAVRS